MGNSKIVYYGETLMDLTGDTVEAEKLLKGVTAHDKTGERITGTYEAAEPYAVIGVTYPAGSVCTCTNGSKTLTAKDTSGTAMFTIPEAGTWTVKAVKGSQTKSQAVSITAEGQVETVKLVYELVLFDGTNGGDNTALTGGWALTSDDDVDYSEVTNQHIYIKAGGYANAGSWYGGTTRAQTKNTIDTSGYSTAEVTVSDTSYTASFSVGSASLSISDSGTFTLDISKIAKGKVQVSVSRPSETWGSYTMTVTKIRIY